VRKKQEIMNIPFLTLRDVVVFPYMIVPLFVGRENSIKSIEKAMQNDRMILLITQKDPKIEEPKEKDIYDVGTVAEVLQMLKLPDGTYKILVEGLYRGKKKEACFDEEYLNANIIKIQEKTIEKGIELQALMRNVINQFEHYIKLNKRVPLEIMMVINNTEEPGRLADIITAHLQINVQNKQQMLEAINPIKRLETLATILSNEIEILNVEKKIRSKVRNNMDKLQKEYYLREQLKVIKKELGDSEDISSEIDELKKKKKKAGLPAEAQKRVSEEIKKMEHMQAGSPEYTVSRNYVDWILNIPWKKKTRDEKDLNKSISILEKDHYGLEKVKERIIEYLAVKQLTKKIKGPILCLVGPPGVGKTSLGKSIARALNRKFTRFSLGGIRDEAEIRGHRRTYIGALPGKIIQLLKQSGSRNPVILLDEIDKMASDFRGDPASALLEVLDPEQNVNFVDNYLSLSFDLSDVLFLTTANTVASIPHALLDRMEVIRIPGYTEMEKYQIASKYLIPRQISQTGLSSRKLKFDKEAVKSIIKNYTREAGVRNLEREIQGICRKVAKKIVSKDIKDFPVIIRVNDLKKYLGPIKFSDDKVSKKPEIGLVNGLAWTEVGGVLLPVEVLITPGKGRLHLTGQLGDIMKESAQAALTYIRSLNKKWKVSAEFYEENDIHIHVPEGAIPKDGPSAGITIATALASAIRKKAVRNDIAMTGEISLRGRVLPIGGLKEKLLAAYQANLKEVIVPRDNKKDMQEIPAEIKKKLNLHFVEKVSDVFKLAIKE